MVYTYIFAVKDGEKFLFRIPTEDTDSAVRYVSQLDGVSYISGVFLRGKNVRVQLRLS